MTEVLISLTFCSALLRSISLRCGYLLGSIRPGAVSSKARLCLTVPGRQCLLKVAYDSHENLRAVCKRWEAPVNHPKFYEDRKKFGISEQCICLLELREYPAYPGDDLEFVVSVFDPLFSARERLPPLPHFPGTQNGIPVFCDCLYVNRKLVLMGGWNPAGLHLAEALNTVFIYDFSSGKWSRGADRPEI